MEVLCHHWHLNTDFLIEVILEMLCDPHEDVRAWAGYLLGDLAEGSCHATASRQLALVAINESRTNQERRLAYYALLKVRTSTEERGETLFSAGRDAQRDFFQNLEDDRNFDRVPQMDIELLRTLVDDRDARIK